MKVKEEILEMGGHDAQGELVDITKAIAVAKTEKTDSKNTKKSVKWDDSDNDSIEGTKQDLEKTMVDQVIHSLENDFWQLVEEPWHKPWHQNIFAHREGPICD